MQTRAHANTCKHTHTLSLTSSLDLFHTTQAGVKLLRKTAALVADVPERRIRPLEALLLKHAKALSPQCVCL